MIVLICILDKQLYILRDLFLQTVSVSIKQPQRAIFGENKAFAFVLQNLKVDNLPINAPQLNSDGSYPSILLSYINLQSKSKLIAQDIQGLLQKYQVNNDIYWNFNSQISIPYIPYFSNCQNYGQYLYLHDIIEDSDLCQLKALNETIPIQQIGFQQRPTSDTCTNVQIKCVLDEAFFNSNNYPKIYEVASQTNLFYITSNPINFNDIIKQNKKFNSLELIPVVSQNEVPSEKLPTSFSLKLSYYQVDKYAKRIIQAQMQFGSFIDKSNVHNNTAFKYDLNITLYSMSHAELAIAFALEWPIYLLLSCIIGIFSIAMILIYFLFYKFSNFFTRRVIPTQSKYLLLTINGFTEVFSELNYFLKLYIPIIQGVLLSFVPSFLILFFISVIFLGGFWSIKILGCSILTSDGICENSIFEIILKKSVDEKIRRGRLAVSLLVIGFYACIRITQVYIPTSEKERIQQEIEKVQERNLQNQNNLIEAFQIIDSKESVLVTEFIDGNIWREKVWKRGLFLFMTMIIVVLMAIIILLSFSIYYGQNIWLFTFLQKLTQIVIEELTKLYIENELLLSALSCVICIILQDYLILNIYLQNLAVTNSVSGLGAPDFFTYLFTAFVSLGIQCFEKIFQVLIVDEASGWVFENVNVFWNWFQKQIENAFNSEDLEDEEEEEEIEEKNKNNQLMQYEQKNEADTLFQSKNSTIQKLTQEQQGKNNDFNSEQDGNSEIMLSEYLEESFATQENIPVDWDIFYDNQEEQTNIKKNEPKDKANKNLKKVEAPQSPTKKTQFSPLQLSYSLTPIKISNFKENEVDHIKNLNTKKQKKISKLKTEQIDQFEMLFTQVFDKKYMKDHKKVVKKEQHFNIKTNEKEIEINRQIKIYGDYCNYSFSLIITPFQVIGLWMLYDANQIFVSWGITKAGLVFYYLFNISNIPFQIFVDILFLKTVEQYHLLSIKEYVSLAKERFLNRKCNWKAEDESDVIKYLEPDLKPIDIWCYSSQYFFCLGIHNAGAILIIEAIITLIANNYNFLQDSTSFFTVLISLFICGLSELLCNLLYNKTSLWKIKREEEVQQIEKSPSTFMKQQSLKRASNMAEITLSNENEKLKETTFIENTQMMNSTQQFRISTNSNDITLLNDTKNLIHFNTIQNKIKNYNTQTIRGKSDFFSAKLVSLRLKNKIPRKSPLVLQQPIKLFNQNLLSPHKYPFKSGNQFQERISEISSMNLTPYRSPYISSNFQNRNSEFTQMNVVNGKTDMTNQYIEEIVNIIKQNRYLQIYIEDMMKQTYDLDISIHQFLVEYLNPFKRLNLPLLEIADQVVKKMKFPNDYRHKFDTWMSFKQSFQKAQIIKEEKQKQKERQLKYSQAEYKDEKFLKRFLQVNKIWLKENIKKLFDDLIKGSSIKQLPIYRKQILIQFAAIYGEIKENNSQQTIDVKIVDNHEINKQQIQQQIGSPIHAILKYWKFRSQVLSIAQKCVAGFLLKVQESSCYYCKQTWGVMLQTKESIEDTFQSYYKEECKRLQGYFNVQLLFEQNQLFLDTKSYQRDGMLADIQEDFSEFEEEHSILSENNKERENSIEQNMSIEQVKKINFNTDSFSDEDDSPDSVSESDSENSKIIDQNKQKPKKSTFAFSFKKASSVLINPPSQVKKCSTFTRQKFIEKWQEYFFENSNFINICLQCNDLASEQFIRNIITSKETIRKQNEINKNNLKRSQSVYPIS